MDIRLEHIRTERMDDKNAVHSFSVHATEGIVGKVLVKSTDGKAVGYKVHGLKAKHLTGVLSGIDKLDLNKALGPISPNANPLDEPPDENQPVEIDHDRRRVKQAIERLTGKKFAKALAEMDLLKSFADPENADQVRYQNLKGAYHGLLTEITKRSVFHENHDRAAVSLAAAQLSLAQAYDKMNQKVPSKMDSFRHIVGLKPSHHSHMKIAEEHLRAAKVAMISGDRSLAAEHKAPVTELSKESVPPMKGASGMAAQVAQSRAVASGNMKGAAVILKHVVEGGNKSAELTHPIAANGPQEPSVPAKAKTPRSKKGK